MISNFYITKEDIIDPKDKDFSLFSCKLTKEIQGSASSVKDIISNIEDFNNGKPRSKRLKYSITVNGFNGTIYVAKCKFVNENFVYIYAYNERGSIYAATNNSDKPKLIDGISTFALNIKDITSVNFGSFNSEDCDFLLENPEELTITEDKMVALLSKEISTINPMISSGEYKDAINHFCIFMKTNKINDYDFNYNSTAFNKYIILCGIYLNLIKNIVGRHDDSTINKNDPKIPNKMYFFEDEESMNEFVKTSEHTRMNINRNNTFYEEDIVIYKQILAKPEETTPGSGD